MSKVEADKELDEIIDGWYDYDSGEWLEPDKDALLAWRDKAVRETEKAFGSCKKCYGKGYATVRAGETYRGATHNTRNQIKYCICDRGKQLAELNGAKDEPN